MELEGPAMSFCPFPSSPSIGTAPGSHPGWQRGPGACAALHGLGAGERQSRVRRLPDSGAVGAERRALLGQHVSQGAGMDVMGAGPG